MVNTVWNRLHSWKVRGNLARGQERREVLGAPKSAMSCRTGFGSKAGLCNIFSNLYQRFVTVTCHFGRWAHDVSAFVEGTSVCTIELCSNATIRYPNYVV